MKKVKFEVRIFTPAIPEMTAHTPVVTQDLSVHTKDMVKQIDELAEKTALAMETAVWREAAVRNANGKRDDMFDIKATITCVESGHSETYMLKIIPWRYTVYNGPLTTYFPPMLNNLRGIISYLLCKAKYSVK